LYIGRRGLGNIVIKFTKVIICFETGKQDINKSLIRHAAAFFPDKNHHFYIRDMEFKHLFKHYHHNFNNANYVNTLQLPSLHTYILYYNKFVDPDPPISEDLTMEFILSALLNNDDVIALVICRNEVISLLFKTNISSGYVEDKLDQQFNMKFNF
jgi:hypothetical protein